MTDSLFEDAGGRRTELVDGKAKFSRIDLSQYTMKLREIQTLTDEAAAQGEGYEHQLKVLTGPIITNSANGDMNGRGEREVEAVRNFKAAGKHLIPPKTVYVTATNLPYNEAEGEQQRTLLRIMLAEKKEDSEVTVAKKAFGNARKALSNAATKLQGDPANEEHKAEVRRLCSEALSTGKHADELVKADEDNQTEDQLNTHRLNMQWTAATVGKLREVVGEPAKAKNGAAKKAAAPTA